LRTSSRFVAFLTGNSGKKHIYKFHQIAGEIWKKSIAEDSSARGYCWECACAESHRLPDEICESASPWSWR